MSSHRAREYSPPRYYIDPHRATTGNVFITPLDTTTRGGQSSSSSSSQFPRSSVSSVSSGRHSVTYQAQPMSKSTFSDGKTTTKYAIRPRNDSLTADSRRSPSISTRQASPVLRSSVLVASPRESMPTVVRDDFAKYLQPASSSSQGSHHRHNSTSMADLKARDSIRDKRDRLHAPKYPHVQKVYHDNRSYGRAINDDEWSYTGPREQFHRDYPQHPLEITTSSPRQERSHTYDKDRFNSEREVGRPQVTNRHLAGVNHGEKDRFSSGTGHESDPDRVSDTPRRRHSTRPPVIHQQSIRDEGYSSARDERDSRSYNRHKDDRYGDESAPRGHHRSSRDIDRDRDRDRDDGRKYDREVGSDDRYKDRQHRRSSHHPRKDDDREHRRDYEPDYDRDFDRNRDRDRDRENRRPIDRRKPRSRDSSPERSGLKSLATGALGSMAAAGVVKGYKDHKEKEAEDDDVRPKERRRRRSLHSSRKADDSLERDNAHRNEDPRRRHHHDNPSSSDSSDDQSPRRHHSHRSYRDDEDRQEDKNAAADKASRNAPKGRLRGYEDAVPDAEKSPRDLVPASQHSQDPEYLESRTTSPGEDEDDRPRRVQLVEPTKEREDNKPRGILKPARQVPFPEDPNPVREGVAPLKDAGKEGIPVSARWTKINRMLVNSEALEKAHERFEERDDYVIVLRVLSREEIKKLADKTKEIRDAREREWLQQLEDQKRQEPDHRRTGNFSNLRDANNNSNATDTDGELNYDHLEEGPKQPLAIEQGPNDEQGLPVNFHILANSHNQPPLENAIPAGNVQVSDIHVMGANYSQNV